MRPEREPAEGRVRPGRLLGGALALALLASLSIVSRGVWTGGELETPAVSTGPTGGIPERVVAGLHGRLIYLVDDAKAPRAERVVVLDLQHGAFTTGPLVPPARTILPAGPGHEWLLLVGDEDGEMVVRLLRDVVPGAQAVEVARGDFVALSPSGRSLLVAETDAAARGSSRCEDPGFRVARVNLATGRTVPAANGPLPCGRLLSIAVYGSGTPLVSLTRPNGLPGTFALHRDGPELLFGGTTSFGVRPQLFSLEEGGDLVVWAEGSDLRVLPSDSRLIGSVLAWSGDGRHVVVDGRVGERNGLWLVDLTERRTSPLSLSGYAVVQGLADAAFDDAGTVFSTGASGVLAVTESSIFPVVLPEGAPAPVRPIAWLP